MGNDEHGRHSAQAADRWQAAASLAAGHPNDAAAAAARRTRRRRIALVVAMATLAPGLAVVVVTQGPLPGGELSEPGPVRNAVGTVLLVLGLVVEVAGLVRLVRNRQWGAAWRTPLLALSHSERRHVLRQIRGHVPVITEQLPVTRALARQLTRQGPLLTMFGGVLVVHLGQTLTSHHTFLLGLDLVALPLFVVGLILLHRDSRAAQRFLARHGDGP